jgi:hypothetical protein
MFDRFTVTASTSGPRGMSAEKVARWYYMSVTAWLVSRLGKAVADSLAFG